MFSRGFVRYLILTLLVLSASLVSGTKLAQAATLTVCSSGCDFSSIQAAINAASSGDTIDIGPGVYQENLVIFKNLTLKGAGADSTIVDGGGAGSVVQTIPDSDITISGVKLMNGRALLGGGIYNRTNLTIANSLISDNGAEFSGGSIFNDRASLVIRNSILTKLSTSTSTFIPDPDTGGSIYNMHGIVSIFGSTVQNFDSNDQGGGIYNEAGTLAVTDSTVRSNSSFQEGGGIFSEGGLVEIKNSAITDNYADDGGGGIGNVLGQIHIVNTTISGNKTDSRGGGILDHGFTEINNSTIVGNISRNDGGGIRSTNQNTSIGNSIIADNNSENEPFSSNCIGNIQSLGHNIASDVSCELNGPGDLQGVDPLLGPLQDNGGPTFTHALLLDSPAIDAADLSNCPATDQRGITRPQDQGCDIGAFEIILPFCVVETDAAYQSGELRLDFQLSSSSTAAFMVNAVSHSGVTTLIDRRIPELAPTSRSNSFAFPQSGVVAVLTTIGRPNGGIMCSDFDMVDTGS